MSGIGGRDPNPKPKCDHTCLRAADHVDRGEPHFHGYLIVPLPEQVSALVERFGLDAVYREVRGREGFCSNCGTPLVADETHVPGGLGHCVVQVPRS